MYTKIILTENVFYLEMERSFMSLGIAKHLCALRDSSQRSQHMGSYEMKW